jgi:ribonuclease PH
MNPLRPAAPPARIIRHDNRAVDELRPVTIQRKFLRHAEGSVLITMGHTRVVCSATVEDRVPPFLRGQGKGWVTAEYGMLPRSSDTRIQRESGRGPSGRTHEIQRLVGRSLRAVTDRAALGERTIILDCDVIDADGGTRTAAITGAYVALYDALAYMRDKGLIKSIPLRDAVAAVSVGIVDDEPILDLCYEEDVRAEVDMNIVMTGSGRLIEVQGTAEGEPFSRTHLNVMLALGQKGIEELFAKQSEAFTSFGEKYSP